MWARIDNGIVAEITDTDPDGRFHPDINWHACDDSVEVGYKHDDGKFMPAEDTPSELTREQVEALRLAAYADPVTGSDRYFAEAARMTAMGEAGADAVIAAGVARYEEIQAEYPWP